MQRIALVLTLWFVLANRNYGQDFRLSIHNSGKAYPLVCLADSGNQIKTDYAFLSLVETTSLVSKLPEEAGKVKPGKSERPGGGHLYIVELRKVKTYDLVDLLKEGKKGGWRFLFAGKREDIRSDLLPLFVDLGFSGFLLDDQYLPEVSAMLPGMICISAKARTEEPLPATADRSSEPAQSRNSLSAYPNPAWSVLQIIYESNETAAIDGQLTLLSASGQIVRQQSLSSSGQYVMDVAKLPPGNYTLACLGCRVDPLPVIIQPGY